MSAEWDYNEGKGPESVECPHKVTILSRLVSAKDVSLIGRELMASDDAKGWFYFTRPDQFSPMTVASNPPTFHFSDADTAFVFKLRYA